MGKNNVLDFKAISNKKLQEQYELEGCDEELLELVSKLVNCSPGSMNDKKKDLAKAELLNKIREQRNEKSGCTELTDDELDSAAGGIRQPEVPNDPNKKPPANNPL